MERTISTQDLKAKLDASDRINIVETLAPELTAKRIYPEL